MHPSRILLYLLIALTGTLNASENRGLKHIQTFEGIEEHELVSNGMRILLMPNDRLPVATVMVTYKVGSRHEVAGTTGATHILEHMMFKGTPRFSTEEGNDYFSIMERIGARSNATTWFDRTNYYATLPSSYVPLAIEIEADRMRNLLIREEDLASEMTVVLNEYERGENNPVRTLFNELFATAFKAHPYSHPTIGWRSDIENVTPGKLRKFYDKYYWPENAVLTIIGGFDREATLDAIVRHYGAIDRPDFNIPVPETVEPPQLGPRRVVVERAGQVGVVVVGYKVPEATHEDWPALLLIDQILGANNTGRLYRALDDKGKTNATFTFAPELHDPGLFIFGAYLTPSASHEEVESTINKEVERLINGGVTEEELQRAKSVIRANIVYGRDGPYSIADQINEAIAMGDWTSYIKRPGEIEAVTAEQIRSVAERYFKKKTSTTGWFVPEAKNKLAQSGGRTNGPYYFRDPELPGNEAPLIEGYNPATAPAKVDFSSSMQRASVAGIDVIAIDMPIEGAVSFVGSFAAGDALSPAEEPMLASLTASMLDKGTLRQDRFAIAELLDTLGAQVDFSADGHSLNFSGRFLRPDAGAVLEILAEQLREPLFDPEVFETVRKRQVANLLLAVDDPSYRAGAQLSRLLYPQGHPNHNEALDSLIADTENTSVDALRNFHTDFYGPESMRLVFAGDIDFEQIKAAVASAFGGWEGGVAYPEKTPPQEENAPADERIEIADKTSVSVNFGFNTGLQRSDPEYLPFMIANYILGGSFNSRLMTEVRQNLGLTYAIYSSHLGDILTPGHWILVASFSPALLNQGLAATTRVLETWHAGGVTEKEVEAAVQTLTGSYLVGLSTTSRVAGQVHSFLQRGLDADYIDQYPVDLKAITLADVNAAIQTYMDPSKAKRVIAGSLGNEAATFGPDSKNVRISIDTPNSAWRVKIEKIYRTPTDELLVLARLREAGDVAAQVVTTVADSAKIPADLDLPVQYYVLGKTWDWGESDRYQFIASLSELSDSLENADLIYEK